jgi:hypothetical protein
VGLVALWGGVLQQLVLQPQQAQSRV